MDTPSVALRTDQDCRMQDLTYTKGKERDAMNLNPIARLLRGKKKPDLKLFALTPPRRGKRSMVGVENMLGSIAVPEPFSLEIAGDPSGVTVMARCREGSVVKQQLGAHYPQGSIQELAPQEDPLRLSEGEQAWSREIHVKGPEYAPLRPFRSDDLVEEGADPLDSSHRLDVGAGCRGAAGSEARPELPGPGLVPGGTWRGPSRDPRRSSASLPMQSGQGPCRATG